MARGDRKHRADADASFFVLRTPLLSFDRFLEWGRLCREALEAASAPATGDADTRALAAARAASATYLRETFADPTVREAVFLASPELDAALESWLGAGNAAGDLKLERALVRYFARMAGRCTPFGLFAGCSVGEIADSTSLELPPASANRRRSRIDVEYVDALCGAWTALPDVRESLRYVPNSSLYRRAGQVRYVEARVQRMARTHHLTSVRDTRPLGAVLERARGGASIPELVQAAVDLGVAEPRASSYVEDLVAEQLLVPEATFAVTGQEPAEGLVASMREAWPGGEWRELDGAVAELAQIDGEGVGVAPRRYRSLAAGLEGLAIAPEPRRLFQVDMTKPAPDATLGRAVVDELLRAAETLAAITIPGDRLEPFREAFAARYETRMVPLAEALDEDWGVGLPLAHGTRERSHEPLLASLPFPAAGEREVRWRARDRLLLAHLGRALAAGAEEIALTDADVEALRADPHAELPPAFAVSGTLAAGSRAALDAGKFTVSVGGVWCSSGAQILGRFCYADERLHELVARHLRAEELLYPDCVLAEIAHLPEGRMGNVICRPVLGEWEIPYLGRSGAPRDRQLPLEDLHLAVRDGELILWSKRLDRRVIPRLTCAHNFLGKGTPIYQLLCLLGAGPGPDGLAWDWGPLADAPFLPRVRHGRVVLQTASWLLDRAEIERLRGGSGGAVAAAHELRDALALPRLIALADGDQQLPIDLENPVSVTALAALLKTREHARLVEIWPDPEQLCAQGPEGRFAHELVVPMIRDAPPSGLVRERASCEPARAGRLASEVTRTFAPGSEWLYAKLYTGAASADHALAQVLAEVREAGGADRWFFLRYADPARHVRVRFHGDPEALHRQVLPAIQRASAKLLERGSITRLVIDTYERELERYGGGLGIELSERIFHVDSEAVLELLAMLEQGEEGGVERWQIGLCGASMLLDDLCRDRQEALATLERLRAGYGREFAVDAALGRALGRRLRAERPLLERLLDDRAPGAGTGLEPGVEVLRRRSDRLAPIVAELDDLYARDQLSLTRSELAASHVHMHLNRVLRALQRRQELVIYDFLLRLRTSRERARSLGQSAPPAPPAAGEARSAGE